MMADQFRADSELERLHFKVERLHQRLNELENGRSVVASAVSGADDRLEDDRTTRGAEVLGVSKARKDSCTHMDEMKGDVAQPTSGASTKKKVKRRKTKKMNGDPARNWEGKYLEGENTDACAPLARPSGYAQAGGLSDTSANDGDASADDGEESDGDDSGDGESDADLDILLDDLRNKPLMRRCRWIAAHPRFNRLILLCIITNSVVLAFDDPLRVTPPAWMRLVESALAVVYVVEVTIKLIAWRLLFFRSAFNTLDFLVALEGAVSTLLLETTGGGGRSRRARSAANAAARAPATDTAAVLRRAGRRQRNSKVPARRWRRSGNSYIVAWRLRALCNGALVWHPQFSLRDRPCR